LKKLFELFAGDEIAVNPRFGGEAGELGEFFERRVYLLEKIFIGRLGA